MIRTEMTIYDMGKKQGNLETLVRSIELYMKNFHMNLQEACEGLEISVEEYDKAKQRIVEWERKQDKRKL